jgi:hypothetical protein
MPRYVITIQVDVGAECVGWRRARASRECAEQMYVLLSLLAMIALVLVARPALIDR